MDRAKKERLLQQADLDGVMALAANPDEELVARLVAINLGSLPMSTDLEPWQNAAVMQVFGAITSFNKSVDTEHDAMLHLTGMLFGFQMGHDYALKYGSLR